MSKGKIIGIGAVLVVIVLGAALFYLASTSNLFISGTYYTKIDNAHLAENDSPGGVINLKSSEPFIYTLPAANESGDEVEALFGTSRELRQDAYLELEFQPLRGVVAWEEIMPEELPEKAVEALE